MDQRPPLGSLSQGEQYLYVQGGRNGKEVLLPDFLLDTPLKKRENGERMNQRGEKKT